MSSAAAFGSWTTVNKDVSSAKSLTLHFKSETNIQYDTHENTKEVTKAVRFLGFLIKTLNWPTVADMIKVETACMVYNIFEIIFEMKLLKLF